MLDVDFVLRVLETSEEIVSEEVEGGKINWSDESIVVSTLGDIVSVGKDWSFTWGNLETGVGFASFTKVVGTNSELESSQSSLSLEICEKIPLLSV